MREQALRRLVRPDELGLALRAPQPAGTEGAVQPLLPADVRSEVRGRPARGGGELGGRIRPDGERRTALGTQRPLAKGAGEALAGRGGGVGAERRQAARLGGGTGAGPRKERCRGKGRGTGAAGYKR